MKTFRYESHANRVIFGEGKLQEATKKELEKLEVKRAIVLATQNQKELAHKVGEIIEKYCSYVYTEAVQHVPVETVNNAYHFVKKYDIDCLVTVGGGSSIGLGKALALRTSLPILAIPTTYAGSEMTPVWGLTEDNLKKTGKDIIVKPKTVIYDPNLTIAMTKRLTVTSGMNAIAHCAEGLYAESANPIVCLFAEEGVRALNDSLPKIIKTPENMEARTNAQYGAMMGGMVLGSVGMALHHKLCHTLGGTYKLPHAETHAIILPYALQYNAEHALKAMQALARALNTTESEVPAVIFDLAKSLGSKMSLKELGLSESDLDEAAEIATKNPYYNPCPVTKEGIRKLLQCAYEGRRPGNDMVALQ